MRQPELIGFLAQLPQESFLFLLEVVCGRHMAEAKILKHGTHPVLVEPEIPFFLQRPEMFSLPLRMKQEKNPQPGGPGGREFLGGHEEVPHQVDRPGSSFDLHLCERDGEFVNRTRPGPLPSLQTIKKEIDPLNGPDPPR